MFGYGFVGLTTEQVGVRRQLLDRAGFQAYLAPIIILVLFYIGRKTVRENTCIQSKGNSSNLELISRRISWMLGTTYVVEFGPLQVQLLGLLYTAFLLFRITYQTGSDYMHVTKALGHVTVSQLPIHYLLSIKSPSSPITLATGLTHERLNAYHRLFGRILHALLATHAILYLRFFALMDLLPKRIQDVDVRLGIIAFWTLNFLGILAIPPIRARAYHKAFYRSHVILSALLLVVLWFHVSYTRIYVAQAAFFWVLNGILRNGASQPVKVGCKAASSDLIQITMKTSGKHLHPYLPGVHVYLNAAGLGPRAPFTVLSARALGDGLSQIKLVAKNSGGPITGSFTQAAQQGKELELQLEGPYGEAQKYMPNLLSDKSTRQQKVLLVAGGVGATYALPIFKALAEARGSAADLKLVWVVRSVQDLAWAQDVLKDPKLTPSLEISITRPSPSENEDLAKKSGRGPTITTSRPDFDGVVDSFFISKAEFDTSGQQDHQKLKRDYDPIVVMVCGPASLANTLRKSVGRHVWEYGRHVRWYEEQFGFGGSQL